VLGVWRSVGVAFDCPQFSMRQLKRNNR
jgi:hypothetical protein